MVSASRTRRVGRLALVAAIIGMVGVVVLAPSSGAAKRKTYAPKDCVKPLVEPPRIVLACGDGGLFVSHLHWTKWRHRHARGKGRLYAKSCVPSCAEGHFEKYPVRIRLRKVKRGICGGQRLPLFRKAILNFPHDKPSHARRIHKTRMFCTR